MLRLVKIPSPEARMGSYPHQMSGGMRQRIVAAMALACEPELLIADEPTTSLDVTIQAQLIALLKEIQQTFGLAMIVITHDFGVVSRICHRVAVMYAGRIIETADVRTLFGAPAHPYTIALLQSLPQIRAPDSIVCPPSAGSRRTCASFPRDAASRPRCSQVMDVCRTEFPPQREIARRAHGVLPPGGHAGDRSRDRAKPLLRVRRSEEALSGHPRRDPPEGNRIRQGGGRRELRDRQGARR